jgi:predicted RND superfamily exporter protein
MILDKIAAGIVKHKMLVVIIFGGCLLVCAILIGFVNVNYNMIEYLPPTAQSTRALDIMMNDFDQDMPDTNVMLKNVSIIEAIEFKKQMAALDGVTTILWLDDVTDVKIPLAMQDSGMLDGFYKDGCAMFMIAVKPGLEGPTLDAIRELAGPDSALSGEAVGTEFSLYSAGTETRNAMLLLIPLGLLILVISSDAWVEPVLYIGAIGVAVLLNMGTNVIFGKVSFIGNSVSPILQLACSLDYAIFLLHSFAANRGKYDTVDEAMKVSVKQSMTAIAASMLTTLFGFLALVFMQFKIGADLGMCLAKGIIMSFISCVVFLPALTLIMLKWVDKTKHRRLLPDFSNVHKIFSKVAVPVITLVALFVVPTFLGQRNAPLYYGEGDMAEGTYVGEDLEKIEEVFGSSTVAVLLVPTGSVVKERNLSLELEKLDHVDSVTSFGLTVGTLIPSRFLPAEYQDQFYSENYARIILYTDTPSEGDLAFGLIDKINAVTAKYYDEGTFFSAGQSANLYDMKKTFEKDNNFVNLIAIIAIFFVLVISFKAGVLPFILLITIEAGIWINLSIPYFVDRPINFIGYLVLCTVQLGATVDYAILLTDHYRMNRQHMYKKEALHKALGDAFRSIIVSGSTLSVAGFTLYFTSSNSATRDIGLLLGRGALLSLMMVVCFLPSMLGLFDQAIAKTTWKAGFIFPEKTKTHGGKTQ